MDLQVFDTFEEASRAAADIIIERIRGKPSFVLGLATGETPLLLYQLLVERHRKGDVNFSDVTTFNLDEYLGLHPTHPQSYRFFMEKHFFQHINIPPHQTNVLDGVTEDPIRTCEAYERAIAQAGGIDLQLLGIGGNGHIAFNEPGAPFESRTRVVDLSDDTIQANSDGRFFNNPAEVPTKALSMGMGTIIQAREILLLAKGGRKTEALRKTVQGPVTVDVPASYLQTHGRCTILVDRAAVPR